MKILANTFVGIVALIHVYFLILETYLYTKPFGLKTFKQTIEQAEASSVLMANQGLYNGFLAAGLIWSLFHPNQNTSFQLKIFFLGCITIAGIYGGFSVSKSILFLQAGPAALAMVLVYYFANLNT